MATISECRYRWLLWSKTYLECQPRDNPGYVGNERKYLRSDETKTLDFSALCGPITGFGTQGSQVQILPLRPLYQLLRLFIDLKRNDMRNELRRG
jgi:hypothetical protein